LILGGFQTGFSGRICGISVDPSADVLRKIIHPLVLQTAEAVQQPVTLAMESILVDDRFLGAGYGRMDRRERDAIRLFAQREGILLDPVYTGRAAGGMLEMIQAGEIPGGDTVLFWHTGGNPALFAYAESLL
jgi:1-aminocyclopropane-1-carboxylate deaminase/D-cysteine desulfhydrase-like pyridoxal-dependent ACC family enzyme